MSVPPTTQLWVMQIEASFEADNEADALAVSERLTARVLEHPAVWAAVGEFDPEQATETVDA